VNPKKPDPSGERQKHKSNISNKDNTSLLQLKNSGSTFKK